MKPSCETVEYARTRLMSLDTRPIVAAITAVMRPMTRMKSRAKVTSA